MEKLLLVLIALYLVSGTLLYFYLKNDQRQKSVPVPPAERIRIRKENYNRIEPDYENVSAIVWECVAKLHRRFELDCPSHATGIMCEKAEKRIDAIKGQAIFRYNIPWDIAGIGKKEMRADVLKTRMDSLKLALEQELPNYMREGYFFSGKVSVWSVDGYNVCIEIHGIGRDIPYAIGDITI